MNMCEYCERDGTLDCLCDEGEVSVNPAGWVFVLVLYVLMKLDELIEKIRVMSWKRR